MLYDFNQILFLQSSISFLMMLLCFWFKKYLDIYVYKYSCFQQQMILWRIKNWNFLIFLVISLEIFKTFVAVITIYDLIMLWLVTTYTDNIDESDSVSSSVFNYNVLYTFLKH